MLDAYYLYILDLYQYYPSVKTSLIVICTKRVTSHYFTHRTCYRQHAWSILTLQIYQIQCSITSLVLKLHIAANNKHSHNCILTHCLFIHSLVSPILQQIYLILYLAYSYGMPVYIWYASIDIVKQQEHIHMNPFSSPCDIK